MQPFDETFTRLLEKEAYGDMLAFLKGLDQPQRKALVPALKKLFKEYLDPIRVEKGSTITFKYKANERHRFMLDAAAFVCCNRLDFEKMGGGWHMLRDKKADDVLPWYCPPWFGDFVNNAATGNGPIYGLTYPYLVQLAEQKYITPLPELVVRVLPQCIFEHNAKQHKWEYKPEALLQYPVTLQEHVWLLFQYPNSINWTGNYQYQEKQQGEPTGWLKVFATFSAQGLLSRERILKEALLANVRNFDKSLSGWFIELFDAMAPSDEETINLQDELFAITHSPHSKAVNTALQCFKKIVADNRFDTERFLETAPALVVSETKSIVSSSLILLEKIAKRFPAKHDAVCGLACQAFIHKDDALQTKAAGIIKKLKLSSAEILQHGMAPYIPSLLVNAKELLGGLIDKEPPSPATQKQTAVHDEMPSAAWQPIVCPENFEDLVFLASQAFDNNQPWHVDVLPAALLKLHGQVLNGEPGRLEAALQRAFKLMAGEYQGDQGYLDHLLATFFIKYCHVLLEVMPIKAAGLKSVEDQHFKKEQEKKEKWAGYTIRVPNLKHWRVKSDKEIYQVHKHILLLAMEKLQTGNTAPLLCTPTHQPGWLSPRALVDRLCIYQRQGLPFDDVDMQVALTRCRLNEPGAAEYASAKLNGETKALLQFLLKQDALPGATITRPSLWMAAALAKAPTEVYPELQQYTFNNLPREKLTGQYAWQPETEHYTENKWDPAQRKVVAVPGTRQVLKVYIKNAPTLPQQAAGGIKKFFTRFIGKAAPSHAIAIEGQPLIYEFEKIHAHFFIIMDNDVVRLMYLFANNPEPLLAQITREALKHVSFYAEIDKKIVIKALRALHHLWKPGMGEMAHVFIAASMLANDKTAAALAAEIWVAAVTHNTVNNPMAGAIAGKILQGELAPLKRFTDLVENYMLGIGPKHNAALWQMFTALMVELPDAPVKNLKKLLEIFLEILALSDKKATYDTLDKKLAVWKQTASLTKLVTTIEGRSAMA